MSLESQAESGILSGDKREKRPRIIISGGGTGGHIYPALAIAGGLKEHLGAELLYVGADNSPEERLAKASGLEFSAFPACGISRKSIKIVKDMAVNFRGLRKARAIIRGFAPDLVIGTGGYVSAPSLYAAVKEEIPIIIHESNAFPGLANRFLGRYAALICLTFADAADYFGKKSRIVITGLPIRKEIVSARRSEARDYFGISGAGRVVLVTGGSQGAKRINDAMADAYKSLLDENIAVIHLTGIQKFDAQAQAVRQMGLDQQKKLILLPYLDRMDYGLAAADAVIGRAGASFLAEICARSLPSVLIPYPFAANNHQEHNALSLQKHGASVVLRDADLTGETLSDALLSVLKDEAGLQAMSAAAFSSFYSDAEDPMSAVKKVVSCVARILAGNPAAALIKE